MTVYAVPCYVQGVTAILHTSYPYPMYLEPSGGTLSNGWYMYELNVFEVINISIA
jgi:hypothetical protein